MKILSAILFTLSLVSCSLKIDCSLQKPVDLNDGLTVSTLEKHNLNKSLFDKINQDICNGKYGNIHSLLVTENNDLVIEQYYNGWERDKLHFLASNTKSFTSILTGIAIGQGFIKSVDQKVLDFFPEYSFLKKDSLKNMITIKDLLTMTSGFQWDEQSLAPDDPDNPGNRIEQTDDWLKSSLMLPMDTVPGTKYVYCGPNDIILSEIIKKATGQTISDYAERNLFKPLGIKEYTWFSKNGVYDSGGGLKLKPRDIAKFGLLHLNRGKWGDTVIVSENWIDEAFAPFIEIKKPLYSCYQWQMIKTEFGFNAWFIPGNGGQIISIIPNLNMVVIINADNRDIPKNKRVALEYLMNDIVKLHPEMKK